MDQIKWRRVFALLCLLGLATIAAQCNETPGPQAATVISGVADTMIAEGPTLFPDETEEPTEEPEPTEVGMADDLNDVLDFNTGQLASGWGVGLDLSEVILVADPVSGGTIFRAITPGVEDGEAFLTANPYWGLIVAGDSDPEGTPPLPGLDVFGMGKWHIGCFAYTSALECELWIREDAQFVQSGGAFEGSFIDGSWTFTFPEGYPPQGDRVGVAVFDPYYFDTLGIDDDDLTVDSNMIIRW